MIVVFISFFLILTGCTQSQTNRPSAPPVTHDLLIKKVGNIWQVVDSSSSSSKVIVKPTDMITWRSDSSDVVFQFPPRNNRYFSPQSKADTLARGFTKNLRAGRQLRFNVRRTAPADTVVYAVFVKKDGVFAEGGSAPIIIIK